jgi:hypothetical protein
MGLFKKRSTATADTVSVLESKLADARARRSDIATRLAAAETSAADARRSVEELATRGASDAELDAAESVMRAKQDREATLRAAITATDAALAAISADLGAAKREAEAIAVAASLDDMKNRLLAVAPAFSTATAEIVETITKSPTSFSEAREVARAIAVARAQIAEALNLLIGELTRRASAVRAGEMNFSIVEEAPAAVAAPELEPVPMEAVYVLHRNIRWRDADGSMLTAAKWSHAELAPSLAAVGRRHQLLDFPTSSRAKGYQATQGQSYAETVPNDPAYDLVDLDELASEDAALRITGEAGAGATIGEAAE